MRNWLQEKNSADIMMVSGIQKAKRRFSKNKRKAKFPKEEDKLWDRFKERRFDGFPVDQAWIMQELLTLSQPTGYLTFKGSSGWIAKWIRRYRVSLRIGSNTKSSNIEDRLTGVKWFPSVKDTPSAEIRRGLKSLLIQIT